MWPLHGLDSGGQLMLLYEESLSISLALGWLR
jgi:hypothetical protein